MYIDEPDGVRAIRGIEIIQHEMSVKTPPRSGVLNSVPYMAVGVNSGSNIGYFEKVCFVSK